MTVTSTQYALETSIIKVSHLNLLIEMEKLFHSIPFNSL